MSVKPELAFDVCWEVYRGARESVGDEAGNFRVEAGEGGEVLVAAGCAGAAE